MNLTPMAMSAEESKAENAKYTAEDPEGGPRYPWGLSLDLDDNALGKLGMSALPKVGETMLIMARVKVTSVRESENQKGTDMGMQAEDAAPTRNAAASLYK